MFIALIIFVVSLAALVYASDKLVDTAVSLARVFAVSSGVLGLTIIAIGTSLPEVASSVVACINNYPGVAFGNVAGSNLCNIGLILSLAVFVFSFFY